MKKYLVLFLLFLAYSNVQSQIDLGIIWQKNIFPLQITSAKISNDGKYVFFSATWVKQGKENTIKKMSLENGEFVSDFDNTVYDSPSPIGSLAMTKNGTHLVSQSASTITIWDIEQEKAIKKISLDTLFKLNANESIGAFRISLDEKYLAIPYSIFTGKEYPPDYIMIYDLELNREVKRFICPDNGRYLNVCFSNSGKFLAIGYTYISQTLPKYQFNQKLSIIDTETWKVTKTLETIENVAFDAEFGEIQFSNNENMLAYISSRHIFKIYDLNNSIFLSTNDSNQRCWNFDLLPNNINYLSSHGNYVLDLNNFNKTINTYHVWAGALDSKIINGKIKVFCYGSDEICLLDEKPLGIETDLGQININVFYNTQNNILKIQNLPLNIKSINITDLVGKNIFLENIQTQMTNDKSINLNLQNGTYFVSIKTISSEVIYNFQVRR